MPSIFKQYQSIYTDLKKLKDEYDAAAAEFNHRQQLDRVQIQARIDNLKEQLRKIGEYRTKVEYFRYVSEKHITSRNIMVITPRELNFRRMRDWAKMIDPTEADDPYAQRIYVQSQCNLMMLDQKQAEFTKLLEELSGQMEDHPEDLERALSGLKKKLLLKESAILEGEDFGKFVQALQEADEAYRELPGTEDISLIRHEAGEQVSFGLFSSYFPVIEEMKPSVKEKLGDFYEETGSLIRMPLEYTAADDKILCIQAISSKAKHVNRGLQNWILNVMRRNPVASTRITVLDGVHFNNVLLGPLKPLEGTMTIESVPRSPEAVLDRLKEIVSEFPDIDEKLGFVDSVREFNRTASERTRITRRIVIFLGYPYAFTGEADRYVRRILQNYEHYGITPVIVDNQYLEDKNRSRDWLDAFADNIYHITLTQSAESVTRDLGTAYGFRWYELEHGLSEAFTESLRILEDASERKGNEYIRRIDLESGAHYTRGNKSIVLPYGIDGNDEVFSMAFDNENFAAYLMGASGSGKSTLLHTLITGILQNYHPDDVELWLADFKMSEFAQYMDPLPPHVRYILLDESQELVFDLIDQLTDRMMERQRYFMRHRDIKKVEQVPEDVYMPVIFVILDEFSIMSQAVAESENYKLKLQNLLAKGRALGIKFLFSSQTFTKGVGGLTQTAKEQVQMRIAMKNSYNEINDTLELSSGTRTDQVRSWMDALPPHYVLIKYREEDEMKVRRLQVMYFRGNGSEAYEPQRRLIRSLSRSMRPVETYSPEDPRTYVDKHPVIVDGNSYKAYREKKIQAEISRCREENRDLAADDILVSLGDPRRLTAEYAVLSTESRENILMIARGAEQACGMSLIESVSGQMQMQGGSVRLWTYGRNRMYRAYRDTGFAGAQIAEGIGEICSEIRQMKERIQRREGASELIVMLGMEQICGDFELIDSAEPGQTAASVTAGTEQLIAKTEEEQAMVDDAADLQEAFEKEMDWDTMEEDLMMENKSTDEIMKIYNEKLQKFSEDYRWTHPGSGGSGGDSRKEAAEKETAEPEAESAPEAEILLYNAKEDLKYIVRQGSRLGYHFMLCVNTLSDLRETGLTAELFRHKLLFQMSRDDSAILLGNRSASAVPEHICLYCSDLTQYSFRPYIHEHVGWDGWMIDGSGEAVNEFME